MAYRRKGSPYWWVSLQHGGKRIRRSTQTTDRREAQALEAKWQLELYRQRQWGETPAFTFDELMLKYLQAIASEKRFERSRYRIRNLKPFFGGRELAGLKAGDLRDYLRHRQDQGATRSTVKKEINLLAGAINFAREEWQWDIPPLPKSRRRRGELLELTWDRVDLEEGLIYFEHRQTKNPQPASVPLNEQARAALRHRAQFRATHCPASPWVFCRRDGTRIQQIRNGFVTACKRAGIRDFRIHDLRHTCAAWLVQAGVTMIEVRDLLRHTEISMTERYAHLAPHNARRAARWLGERAPQNGHTAPTSALKRSHDGN